MFIEEAQYKDLDLEFIFDRIQVDTPYGEIEKKSAVPFNRKKIFLLEEEFNQLEKIIQLVNERRYDILELKGIFKTVKQLGTTFERIEGEETLSVTELFEIKSLLIAMRQIRKLMIKIHWEELGITWALEPADEAFEILDPEHSGTQSFYIYTVYSEELKRIRQNIEKVQSQINKEASEIKNELEKHGLRLRTNGEIQIQKNSLELIEFAKKNQNLEYQSELQTVQIYKIKTNSEYQEEIEKLNLKEEEEEYRIRTALSLALKLHLDLIVENARKIGKIDYMLARASFSIAFNCVRPRLNQRGCIEIKDGRHLKVAHRLSIEKKTYTPVDVKIENRVTLITGANMGGKTVSMKMIGLIVAMAHFGIFVPCSFADISLFDFIFLSVGDSQSIDMGLSTFGGEIHKIGRILKRESEDGLLLIDELARGTNPKEGYAISRALIEHLSDTKLTSIITTHYDGLTSINGVDHYQVKGLSGIDFSTLSEEKGMVLLHELMDYRLNRVSQLDEIPKDALRISEFMGLDQKIIDNAKKVLGGSDGE